MNSSQLFAQIDTFELPLTVSNGISSVDLLIGARSDATDDRDIGIDIAAPPLPPNGYFYGYIESNGTNLHYDYRATGLDTLEFLISLQSSLQNDPIIITWDSTGLSEIGSFHIKERFTSQTSFDLDMTTVSSLDTSTPVDLSEGIIILVTSPQNQPPAVSITSPGQGASFTEGDTITLEASASDSDGAVTQVEYFADGSSIGLGSGANYSFSWSGMTAGSYSLTAVATDDSSATTTSDPVSVTVNAPSSDSTLTLTASEDTYVRGSGAYSNTNFDGQDSLFVKNGTSPSERAFSYLKFDLSTITDSIESAVVKLYPYEVGGAPLHEVALTTQAWTASTLNWNSRPQVGDTLMTFTPVQGVVVMLDLTAEAQAAWEDTSQMLEIRLAGASPSSDTDWAIYSTMESDTTSNRPVIEVTTTGSGDGGTPQNQPPAVSITSPGQGASFTEGDTITLEASASDSDGAVTQVEYFADGSSIGLGSGANYSFSWSGMTAGSYSLTAVATDDSSATTTSDPVSVTVNAPSSDSTLTLTASEDTYVRGSGAYSNTNFDGQDSLFVKNGTSPSERAFSYLKFDLSTITDSIESAVVKLYPYEVGGAPLHEVALTTQAWTASTLNWNSRPQVGDTLMTFTPVQGVVVMLDLTAEAQAAWEDTSQMLEIRLAGASPSSDTDWAIYSTMESDTTSNRPVIEVTTTGSGDGGTPQNQPPAVSITSPGQGASFIEGDTITLEANASDSDGAVTQVEYFADGSSIGLGSGANYSFSWSGMTAGSYSLTAVATDDSSATTTSDPVSVTVNAPGSDSTLTLTASEDTYVRGSGAYSNTNFDGQDSLFVKNGTSPGERAFSYLKFDLSTITDSIESAVVKLYPYEVGGAPLHEVALTTQAWTASTLNWNSRPQVGDTLMTFTPVQGVVVMLDLTAEAQAAWEDTSQMLEIRLAGASPSSDTDWAIYSTMESDTTSNRPVIEVTTTGSGDGGTPQNQPPAVSITSPGQGASFIEGDTITLEASASDSDGAVTQVEYFADGSSIGLGSGANYSFSWSGMTAGSYSLTAVATDDSSATTTSDPVSVTVNAPGSDSTLTLTASEDTYVRGSGAYSNTNFDGQDSLFVKNGTSPGERAFSYLKFDLSTITDSIESAVVKLYPYEVGGAPLHEVALTTQAWTASTLNWNSRPQVGDTLMTFTPVQGVVVMLDLTAEAQAAWEDTSQMLEIRLAGASPSSDTDWAIYSTMESDTTSNRPVIEVTTTGSGDGGTPQNQPPAVSITSPGQGASFIEGDTITLEASASDSDGAVTQVEYFADGSSIGLGSGANYSFSWSGMTAGSYSLTAVATDDSSATTTSDPVSVTVNAPSSDSTLTLTASEDTYVRGSGAYSNTNFDGQDSLFVKNGTSPSERAFSYLKFDLSTITDSIESAVVKLYPYEVGGAPLHEVALTTQAWTASTLNWNSRPQVGDTLMTFTPVQGVVVMLDLTAEAQAAWEDTSQMLEIRLAGASPSSDTDWAIYSTMESDTTSNRPVIEVTLTPSPGGTKRPVTIEEWEETPEQFTLIGNYPNPFNPTTTIMLNLPEDSEVIVEVFDLMGRKVLVMPSQRLVAGNGREIPIDASKLASGIYLYKVTASLTSGDISSVGQMVLMK